MSTSNLGDVLFRDAFSPAKGKTEWGVDTLTRKLRGARSGLNTFIATLAQGQSFPPGFSGYYLQTWDVNDDPNVAEVILNYKGLVTGGTPEPDPINSVVSTTGSTSVDFSTENDGKGRIYRKEPLYKQSYSVPGEGILYDIVLATRDIYATAVVMEFTYRAAQTQYRYITVGKPNGPRYDEIDFDFTLEIEKARIHVSNGETFGRVYATNFGLAPVERERVISFGSQNIIGSPYWECEDVVRLQFEDQSQED